MFKASDVANCSGAGSERDGDKCKQTLTRRASARDETQMCKDQPGRIRRKIERLQDEVYRHLFRLEAHHQGAELDLSVALLRAWQAAEGAPTEDKEWMWLRNICPICIKMIDASKRGRLKGSASIQ